MGELFGVVVGVLVMVVLVVGVARGKPPYDDEDT